ncbi:MAG TPA: hypothetical protein PKL31_08460 [Fulvivirga sp.]|nr:hypothetical protein [Fulvivirga sp.]
MDKKAGAEQYIDDAQLDKIIEQNKIRVKALKKILNTMKKKSK